MARKGAGIKSVADLKGKRVALDEPGSGTLVDARIILARLRPHREADIKPEYLKPNQAGDKMRDGGLDAFFFVGGYPAGAIAELASSGGGIELMPIDRARSRRDAGAVRFFSPDTIPANTYKGVARGEDARPRRAMGDVREGRSRRPSTRSPRRCGTSNTEALDAGHAKGKSITKENAVTSAGIPFHPGCGEVLPGGRADEVAPSRAIVDGRLKTARFALPPRRNAMSTVAEVDRRALAQLEEKFDPEMRFRPTLPPADR